MLQASFCISVTISFCCQVLIDLVGALLGSPGPNPMCTARGCGIPCVIHVRAFANPVAYSISRQRLHSASWFMCLCNTPAILKQNDAACSELCWWGRLSEEGHNCS